MYTLNAAGKRVYTLKKINGDNEVTKSAHPARFSPDDKWSKYVYFPPLPSAHAVRLEHGGLIYMTNNKAEDERPIDGRQGRGAQGRSVQE